MTVKDLSITTDYVVDESLIWGCNIDTFRRFNSLPELPYLLLPIRDAKFEEIETRSVPQKFRQVPLS